MAPFLNMKNNKNNNNKNKTTMTMTSIKEVNLKFSII